MSTNKNAFFLSRLKQTKEHLNSAIRMIDNNINDGIDYQSMQNAAQQAHQASRELYIICGVIYSEEGIK